MPREKLKRLTIRVLTALVDELIERAVDELWRSVYYHDVEQRVSKAEARGLWWGAFCLALDMGGCPAGTVPLPEPWRFTTFAGWVLEAAEEERARRAAATAGEARP